MFELSQSATNNKGIACDHQGRPKHYEVFHNKLLSLQKRRIADGAALIASCVLLSENCSNDRRGRSMVRSNVRNGIR